ncbi:hypothetical protein MKW94_013106 [Papaver nudicaule]|uniref:Uncharacterized protein n=1 Tax=Papaver nudicaule TaxID=74823 RepID=A0AA41VDS6_PAPNU|nr:hypothetical protein [Papaver nudicaule]
MVNIKSILQQFLQEQIRASKKRSLKLILKVVYANPWSKLETIEDAFDIAVKGVLGRVDKVRNDIRKGRIPGQPPYLRPIHGSIGCMALAEHSL